jgi:hypothetical protein
LLYRCESQN